MIKNQDSKVPAKVLTAIKAASSEVHEMLVNHLSQDCLADAIKNSFIKSFGERIEMQGVSEKVAVLKARVAELEKENKRLLDGYDELAKEVGDKPISRDAALGVIFDDLQKGGFEVGSCRLYTKEMQEAVEPLLSFFKLFEHDMRDPWAVVMEVKGKSISVHDLLRFIDVFGK